MTKVYPNGSTSATATGLKLPSESNAVVLTVWKKSLLLNCDGFTVFDSKGNLVFRVDNYMAGSQGEIILMDASGKSLLTIRRKRLSLSDNWLVFEEETAVNPRYSVTKHVSLLNTKSILAHVTSISSYGDNTNCKRVIGDHGSKNNNINNNNKKKKVVMYEIEGSYAQRCCTIYDDKRRQVAEIKRKEAVGGMVFGVDVFRLIVSQPHQIDLPLAMALVILLDQMFGSSRRPNLR